MVYGMRAPNMQASCGSCTSHNGCEDRGAHDQCCSYKLVAANKKCVHPNSVGCIFGSGKAYAWGSVSGNIDRAGWGGVWKYCTNNECPRLVNTAWPHPKPPTARAGWPGPSRAPYRS